MLVTFPFLPIPTQPNPTHLKTGWREGGYWAPASSLGTRFPFGVNRQGIINCNNTGPLLQRCTRLAKSLYHCTAGSKKSRAGIWRGILYA